MIRLGKSSARQVYFNPLSFFGKLSGLELLSLIGLVVM